MAAQTGLMMNTATTTAATTSGTSSAQTKLPFETPLAADAANAQTLTQAAALLTRLFKGLTIPVSIRLWNGTALTVGNLANSATAKKLGSLKTFTLVCRSPAAVRAMVMGTDPLRLAEVYFRDEVDIEGNFFAALGLKDHLQAIRLSWRDRVQAIAAALQLSWADRAALPVKAERNALHSTSVKLHSKAENRDAIAFHYDVSNDFYALWLDDAMVYSCAYFEHADISLANAQQAKLDHVCRKLMLRPGDKLLDIGCGWGALAIHAAQHYGVQAHGITLSKRQLALARERVAQAGLQNVVTLELRDYRDLDGEGAYDKVSSVGMFEHIGLNNLPVYFAKVHHLLKPGGLFLNHGITHDVEGWEKTLSSEFINRYVFPDGQLDTVSNIQRVMERAHFEITDVESLRPHYALTLRHWVARLEQHHDEALQYVTEATWRIWRLYMAACALEFESGEIGVYQVLASKRAGCLAALPLTRQHLYSV